MTGNWKLETGSPRADKRKSKSENRSVPGLRPGSIFHFRFPLFEFRFSNFLARLVGCVFAFACPVAAYAQGCPLCYNTAAAAKASGIQALRSGILILVIPPLLICVGVLWRGIKARDLFNVPEPAVGEPQVERELAELLAQTAPALESWKIENRKAKIAEPAS
jgi:hypothetical protein